MSIHRSYFKKNNTIVFNSDVNTGRNPVVELFFGTIDNLVTPKGYSRFIFDLDLQPLIDKIQNGEIGTGCTDNMSHILNMTNTSSFDKDLLNDSWSNGRRRATSFDLVLYRIPKTSGTTGDIQSWDEGVGYDYYFGNSSSGNNSSMYKNQIESDKSFSQRPSNWFKNTTISNWSYGGIYDNTNTSLNTGIRYDNLHIVDTQHFEFGNEDIEFDMTDEINGILDGTITDVSGWGISFLPDLENITGLTENYSVGFFSRHTQTFYEPFLQTNYNNLIEDDRLTFYEKKLNKLYLYSFNNGNPQDFDENPIVDLYDTYEEPIPGFTNLPTCKITSGVYEISISGLTADTTPCMIYDFWKNIKINGIEIDGVENEFVIKPLSELYQIGIDNNNPSLYGFDFYGIKQDEKILNTDVRKVNVVIKKAYTTNEVLQKVESYYRVYVKEGQTEVQVEDWTPINRTPDSHYFMFDTRDKIPNEYFIDIKVITDREVNTYKRELKFQIVNKK
jgi:hypothetical protein